MTDEQIAKEAATRIVSNEFHLCWKVIDKKREPNWAKERIDKVTPIILTAIKKSREGE